MDINSEGARRNVQNEDRNYFRVPNALIRDHGQPQRILDPDGVAEVEPALAPVKHKLAGAIYGPTDSSGDSVKFTRDLQAVCERMGTRFVLGTGQ